MKNTLLFLFLTVNSFTLLANSSDRELSLFADVTIEACDGEDNDGVGEFDLAGSIFDILDGMDPNDYSVTFYPSIQEASTGLNEIDSNLLYTSASGSIFSRIENLADPSLPIMIDKVTLVVNRSPSINIPDDVIFEICPNSEESLEVRTFGNNYNRDNATFQWYLDSQPITGETRQRIQIDQAGFYELEVTYNNTGCSSIEGFSVNEVQNCVIPQGISPNGDGINDSFDLTDFRVSNIEIFNRYGTRVFASSNYTNQWSGQDENGNELPVGTYFYTMNYKEGLKASGWVYIQREK